MRGKRTVGISLLSCSRIPFACIELTHADTRLCLTHRFVGSNALETVMLGPPGYEGDAGLKSCKDLARYYD